MGLAESSTAVIERAGKIPGDLFPIQSDIIPSVLHRFDSPRHWRSPIVVLFETRQKSVESTEKPPSLLEESYEEPLDNSTQVPDSLSKVPSDKQWFEVEKAIAMEKDMLTGVALILEDLPESYLSGWYTQKPNSGIQFAVTVLKAENYINADFKNKAEVLKKYGVLPRNKQYILFQGILSEAEDTSLFQYLPVSITGELIEDPAFIETQQKYVRDYLTKPHPNDQRTTPFGMLVSLGITPHR